MNMVLLDRLRRNDKTYTELVFYENDFSRSDNFLELVTAILMNTTVHTVRFHDCANPKWSPKQLKLLFATIARLPCLRLLSIAQTRISIQFLTIILQKTKTLLELDVWGSELVGTDYDVDDFATALRAHSELEAVYLKRVTFSENISSLDTLVKACRSTLDILTMEQVEWPEGALSGQSLAYLATSSSSSPCESRSGLTQLTLEKLNLEECHFQALAAGLQGCTSLRDLHLSRLTMSDEAVAALAHSLKKNESLKRLVINQCQLSDRAAVELANMLKVNTTLSHLELSENLIGDKGAINLASALLMSSSIKRLQLYGNTNIQERGIQAFVQLAEQNYVLEALELFTFSHNRSTDEQVEIQKKINSFMDLNDVGRTRRNSGKRPKVWYE